MVVWVGHCCGMTEILQAALPEDMASLRALPGIQPVQGPWLRIDDAYAGQMARRVHLMASQPADVLYCPDASRPAAQELLAHVCDLLPGLGFDVTEREVMCPDGRRVSLDMDAPLETLGRLVQCDFCLLDKDGPEHVLKAAVLCFPASWSLAEKAGRPLVGIHEPVDEYDSDIAARVQRLFDGVQVGRPLWRFNRLIYADPELFQPRSRIPPILEEEQSGQGPAYLRAERQSIFRLPDTRWVVFAIHTYVVRR